MQKLILASSSLGRKRLLDYLGLKYEIIPSGLDEDKITGKTPMETIRLRARLKGEKVAGLVSSDLSKLSGHLDSVIILSADSDAILENQLFSKPKDRKEAFYSLSKLSGKTHEFITSVHIIKTDPNNTKEYKMIYSGETKSLVTFRKITSKEIDFYLDHTDYTRFAGSYALISAQNFITKVVGSTSNVVGLPLENIIPVLQKESILK